jgi:hypothetical protein
MYNSENNIQSIAEPINTNTTEEPIAIIVHNAVMLAEREPYESIDLEEHLITQNNQHQEINIITDEAIDNEEKLCIRMFLLVVFVGLIITAFYTFM